MAVVPTLRRQVDERPPNRTLPNARATPDAFGSDIGRAFVTLGGGLSELQSGLDARQVLEDEAQVAELTREFLGRRRDILNDPDSGALAQTGLNVPDPDKVETELRGVASRLTEGQPPSVRQAFERSVESAVQSAANQVATNRRVQQRNAIVDNQASSVGILLQDAVGAGSREAFDDNLLEALRTQARSDALQGAGAETIKQNARLLQSAALRGRISQLTRDDPLAAQAFFEENADNLTPEDAQAVRKGLDPLVRQRRARDIVDEASREAGPQPTAETSTGLSPAVGGSEGTGDNPNSSAVGVGQIIDQTLPVARDDLLTQSNKFGLTTEEFVRLSNATQEDLEALRVSDDPADAALFRKMVDAHAEGRKDVLRGAGFAVNDLNLKLVWQFGDSGGIKFLQRFSSMTPEQRSNTSIRTVLSEAAIRANPELTYGEGTSGTPKSIADVYETKEDDIAARGGSTGAILAGGASGGTADAASAGAGLGGETDVDAVLDRISRIEDPQLRAAALDEFDLQRKMRSIRRDARGKQLYRDAVTAIDEEGFNPNDMSAAEIEAMGTARFSKLQSIFKQVQTGNDVTNTGVMLDLEDEAAERPTAFARRDLSGFRDQLSVADFRRLRNLQRTIEAEQDTTFSQIGGLAGVKKLVNDDPFVTGAFMRSVDNFSELSEREDAQLRNRFTVALMTSLSRLAEQRDGPITLQDVRNAAEAIAGSELRDEGGGLVGDRVFSGDAAEEAPPDADLRREADRENIPRRTEVGAIRALQGMLGAEPDETELDFYLSVLQRVRTGESPGISFADIPQRLRRRARLLKPGLDEDEIVDEFVAGVRILDREGFFE